MQVCCLLECRNQYVICLLTVLEHPWFDSKYAASCFLWCSSSTCTYVVCLNVGINMLFVSWHYWKGSKYLVSCYVWHSMHTITLLALDLCIHLIRNQYGISEQTCIKINTKKLACCSNHLAGCKIKYQQYIQPRKQYIFSESIKGEKIQ